MRHCVRSLVREQKNTETYIYCKNIKSSKNPARRERRKAPDISRAGTPTNDQNRTRVRPSVPSRALPPSPPLSPPRGRERARTKKSAYKYTNRSRARVTCPAELHHRNHHSHRHHRHPPPPPLPLPSQEITNTTTRGSPRGTM